MEGKRKIFDGPCDVIFFILMFIIVVGVFFQILLRYVFKYPISWADEVVTRAFVVMVFAGAVVSLRRGTDVFVDIISYHFKKPYKEYADFFLNFLMLGFCLGFTYVGVDFALFNVDQMSISLRVPMIYYYMVMPICSAFTSVIIVLKLIGIIKVLRQRETRFEKSKNGIL